MDYYTIYYRPSTETLFEENTVESDASKATQSFVIEKLVGAQNYVIKICAGTISLSSGTGENKTIFGQPSLESSLYLPEEKCLEQSFFPDAEDYFQGELSAGMIVGAVCAVLFLLLAVIGFVVWR